MGPTLNGPFREVVDLGTKNIVNRLTMEPTLNGPFREVIGLGS